MRSSALCPRGTRGEREEVAIGSSAGASEAKRRKNKAGIPSPLELQADQNDTSRLGGGGWRLCRVIGGVGGSGLPIEHRLQGSHSSWVGKGKEALKHAMILIYR